MSVPMIKSKFEIPNQETFSPEPISPENILFVIPRNVEIGRVLFAVTLFKLNNVVNHFNICKLFAIIIYYPFAKIFDKLLRRKRDNV